MNSAIPRCAGRTSALLAGIALCVGGVLLSVMLGCWLERDIPDENQALPIEISNPYVIEVTGSKKNWYAKYPDETGHTQATKPVSAAEEIHLPLGTTIVLLLKSTDYVYTFSIPERGLKEIAVPTLEFQIQFEPEEPAEFILVGEPLCGEPHSQTSGRVIIEPAERFVEWRRTKLAGH